VSELVYIFSSTTGTKAFQHCRLSLQCASAQICKNLLYPSWKVRQKDMLNTLYVHGNLKWRI
jgi:hypothetical protein